jgi:PAS domain S-box-containing protein
MATTIDCVHCGRSLHVPSGMSGRRVRCAYCHRDFVLPDEADEGEIPVVSDRPGPARDDTLSRSMLMTMPGMVTRPAEEMIGRLEPGTLRWLGISEGLREFLGRPIDQIRHQTFLDYLHADDRALAEDEFRQAVEVGERHDFVLRLQGKSGQWHYMRIYTQARYEPSGRVHHIRCNLKDVTDRVRAEQELRRRTEQLTAANEQLRQANLKLKEAQTQLVHSEKLAAVGTLAAGMAHEINNPLAFASNNVAVLERDVGFLLQVLERYEEGLGELRGANPARAEAIARLRDEVDLPYLQQHLVRITQATRKGLVRVAEIVQNLRNFAQVDRAEVGEFDVNESLNQSLAMVGDILARQRITVVRELGEVPRLEGAPAHINQVFLNLLMNGMQAIEAAGRPSGRIRVATRRSGDEVVVEVGDDGCGIPADVLPRIFEPFFTTKPIGRGTGLGLSLAHGIISDHGGRIEAQSAVGAGSLFRVHLPVKRAPARTG